MSVSVRLLQGPPRQNMVALNRGQRVRLARAGERRRVAEQDFNAGRDRVIAILHNPTESTRSMPVGGLLLWIHRMGPFRMRQVVARAEVLEAKKVGELTVSQRERLVAALRGEPVPLIDWRGGA